jgi:general secretion pathway protein A
MFLSHFSLNEHPFMEQPPIGWLMRDPRFDEALAGLQFFEQQGSIGLILGQTGIGKSSLLRLFMHELPQNRYRPLYLHLTPINANAFLRLMVNSLGEKPRIGKDRMLLQILDRINQNEKDTLMIIDEAHLIDPKTLTDLRVLISSIGERVPLKILLCGQEDLRHVLKRSSHADLLHRITLRLFLKPYTKDQTAQYIDNRIAKAGGSDKIFEPEAKALIHDYAAGIPRQINNIATACLLAAISQAIQKISDAMVNNTMARFQLP